MQVRTEQVAASAHVSRVAMLTAFATFDRG